MSNLANVKIIRTDGTTEEYGVGKHILMDWICRMIGADSADSVNLRDGRVMIVDGRGWETRTIDHGGGHITLEPVRPLKPINAEATKIYHSVCVPGATHQIAGDVAIARDEDFAGGGAL
jgi:hypothetical protein